ncbi:OmpA family protein [Kineosporia sp. J2-2]|uniref:OmpA family protein n=1 Tax=Kineosporia corallincola TaxID=2835133 RepID=A0ABS5TNS0_9ACTN|nr:OmpA family protein [Kineosporia corallincola]
MISRVSRVLVAITGLLAGFAVLAPAHATSTPTGTTATSSPTPMGDDELGAQQVPVLGSVTLQKKMTAGEPKITVLINGVRRIPGATVLYYSAGLPEGAEADSWVDFSGSSYDYTRYLSGPGNVFLVDFSADKLYAPLFQKVDGDREEAMGSPYRAWPSAEPGGTFYALYAVMPELPDDLTTVDVMLGHGDVVHDVPIGEGVMEPAVVQEDPIRMGEAWPQIDQAAAAASWEPENALRDLRIKSSNADGSVTEETEDRTTTVNLSSDVLFEVDSAELGDEAGRVLQKAADSVNGSATGGEIKIIGYTDSTGTDSHNLKLSRQRAQAVATALKPLITVSGVTYDVSGRGEQDPVGKNDTEAGRAQNRRVSVVFGEGNEK